MCGIAGFLTAKRGPEQVHERIATAMADRLAHRGPDDAGTWTDVEAGLALAHRRLAIIDLSPAGHQPMVSGCGRYVIAFNGEIYNHLELRSELDRADHVRGWRGHSDTETLLALIAARGVRRALEACIGMFAFALWDRVSRRLVLARDRLGEKPLYYGWQGNVFLFASELKALHAHPRFCAEPNRDALCLLLRYGYVPAPHSIYRGIGKLPPASYVTVALDNREAIPAPYWSFVAAARAGEQDPFRGDEAAAADELEHHLGCAIQSQSVADVPLGALLSGGIDSSTVVALMQARSRQPIKTFTIGFSEKGYNEAAHAAAVAKHVGTDHTGVVLSPGDALSLIPELPKVYDEPFADASQLPTQLVMRLARRRVTVALSGDGGDELLGGYNRYRFVPQLWRRIGWIPRPLGRALGMSLLSLSSGHWDRLLRPVAPLLGIAQPGEKVHKLAARMKAIGEIDDLFFALISAWERPAKVVSGATEPSSVLSNRHAWPTLQSPVAQMMALDTLTYLPDDILTKVDRASMSVSLETRAPFLDPRVVEFATRLPMHMKIRDGTGKWLLRQVLYRHVPRPLVERPKMGFGIPLDAWLRGPLKGWADALLDPITVRQQGYFDPTPVERVWRAHVRGASNGTLLWPVLMFQAWLAETTSRTTRRASLAA